MSEPGAPDAVAVEGVATRAEVRGIGRQLVVALVEAPGALPLMSRRSWARLAVYFALSSLLLFGLAAIFAGGQKTLERALLGFLFPAEWHGALELLLGFVLKAQAQQVVVNVVLFLTLTLVSIVFFFAKEALSQSYERDLAARRGWGDARREWREYPFWAEAFEEIKWTLVGVALMFVVLWVGHAAEPWRKTLAMVLSYGVLFFTTAGNFLMPPMQRRRVQYGQLLKAMLRKPLLAFGFGAAVSLPQVAVLHAVSGSDLSALISLIVIFAVNIVFICWSTVAGTHAGLLLLPTAAATAKSHVTTRVIGWVAVLSVLVVGAVTAARLGVAIAAKSQLLKCTYAVDWSTVNVAKPELGGLLRGEVAVGLSFEVEIANPNELPVRIEANRLVVSDDDVVIAESHLSPFDVPAHDKLRTRVGLDAKVRAASILEGARLNPLNWDITFYIDIGDGYEYPIYLRDGAD